MFQRHPASAENPPERVKSLDMPAVLRPRAQRAHRWQRCLPCGGHGQNDVEGGLRHSGRTGDVRKIGPIEVHATRLAPRG
ncbi:hypothetical protein Sala_2031 [Sphingopyxis alaskensis RB2256]|uniref:Uncharacterized protein n=1 Tax=Sphingopyxis alaskensis (strain DSM 13593 / LMG 18877 / RB2256) TaxID=317655 RepID=Q1GRI0_SPHAL|nr:hypothetical protein Sala_2031 [Sphingopyxis alaskensis RB2256]